MPVRFSVSADKGENLGPAAFWTTTANRAVLTLRSFKLRCGASGCRTPPAARNGVLKRPSKSPPENYGKEDQTLPLLHPCSGGFVSPSPSPLRETERDCSRKIAVVLPPPSGRRLPCRIEGRPGCPNRHVHLDAGRVGLVDFGGLRHVALALGAFRRKQVTPRGMLPPHFSRPGDLEPFRDGFPGFAARNRLWHKARKIAQPARLTTAFAALL